MAETFKLHIGGQEPKPGWKILNIQPGPGVDFVGDCTDLSRFADESISEIYASHVMEHLSYQNELTACLKEMHRILTPDGVAMISVPDLETLAKLFAHPQVTPEQRFHIMRMMFGGQMDAYDFHKVGLNHEFMNHFAGQAGFVRTERVQRFGFFNDASEIQFGNVYISLNIKLFKQ